MLMKRKIIGLTLYALLFALCVSAQAQQPKKVPRIGYLTGATRDGQSARIDAFRQGLRELGYVEGKNIVVEYRYAEEKFDRLPALAAELVHLKVDVIVTGGSGNTSAAKEATNTIPIVMAQDSDPVGNGFVASLARPGGNITGLATLAPEIGGKQLELLKEVVPKLSRVAVLAAPSSTRGNVQQRREIEAAARAFDVQLQFLEVLGRKDIQTAFRAANKGHADAVLVLRGSVLGSQRTHISEFAVKSRLPAIYGTRQSVEAGGLMSYSVNFTD